MFTKSRIAIVAFGAASVIGLGASAASACACAPGYGVGGYGTGGGTLGGGAVGGSGLNDPGNAPTQGIGQTGMGLINAPITVCGDNVQIPVGGAVPVLAVPLGGVTGSNAATGNASCEGQQGSDQGTQSGSNQDQQQGADQGQGQQAPEGGLVGQAPQSDVSGQ